MSNRAIINIKIYGSSFSQGKGIDGCRRKLSNTNNAKQPTQTSLVFTETSLPIKIEQILKCLSQY